MFAGSVAERFWVLLALGALLTAIPCFADCTLRDLAQHNQPPCHQKQHHSQPTSDRLHDCERQKSATALAPDMPAVEEDVAQHHSDWAQFFAIENPARVDSSPPLIQSSVLRI